MVSDLDSRITSQLSLHRGLQTLAAPLLAILREKLLMEKLLLENQKQPPSLEVAMALESLDRYNELAEKIQPERGAW
jgi:hypothetical protein